MSAVSVINRPTGIDMQIPKKLVTLDFETFFDSRYTLKRGKYQLSTSEFVRDERFLAHGVGIRSSREKTAKWYTGERIAKKIQSIDWDTTAVLCHNTAFDGLILTHHYDVKPCFYFDTMSMARALLDHTIGVGLDEVAEQYEMGNKIKGVLEQTKGLRELPPWLMKELGRYCATDKESDVNLTWNIFRVMMDQEGYPEDELRLIDLTIRAFVEPVLQVNKPMVEEELKDVRAKQKRLMNRVKKDLGTKDLDETAIILRSDNKLAAKFRELGYPPPMKTMPSGKVKPAFAKVDLGFIDFQKHPEKVVRDICEARLTVKSNIAETRAIRLLDHADPALPIMLNYCRAHTFRWSGGDKLNPQNFQRISDINDPKNGRLRKSLTAPYGYKLVIVDSSQIEARVLAWCAGQTDLLASFLASDQGTGQDPYCMMASVIYGREIDKKKDWMERFVGKVAVLGLGYGMGWEKFMNTLESGAMGPSVSLDPAAALAAVNAYRRQNRRIKLFWKAMEWHLEQMLCGQEVDWEDGTARFHQDGVDMPNGLTLWYPELEGTQNPWTGKTGNFSYKNGYKRSKIYGGLFAENFTQALARIIVGWQMLKIAERYRVVMMTHDEVVYLAKNREANKAFEFGLEALRIAPSWCKDLPLNAEGYVGDFYCKT